MRNIIVTGATSMIGIALIKSAIIDRDINHIYAVLRPGTSKKDRLPKDARVSILERDMQQYVSLVEMVSEPVDCFYHLAWTRTPTYEESLEDVYKKTENLLGVIDALQAASRMGCSVFVGAGSQSEYGIIENGCIGPDTPCNPVRADGILHLAAGELVKSICKQKGIDSAWLRIFSVYGVNDRDNSMIKTSINKLLKGEKCTFTPSEQMWDYLYEKDAGDAFLAVGKRIKGNKTYCLGKGDARPLKEYLYEMRDIVSPGTELGIGELPYPKDPVMNMHCDISALVQDTGWVPQVTFGEGIQEVFSAMKSEM